MSEHRGETSSGGLVDLQVQGASKSIEIDKKSMRVFMSHLIVFGIAFGSLFALFGIVLGGILELFWCLFRGLAK